MPAPSAWDAPVDHAKPPRPRLTLAGCDGMPTWEDAAEVFLAGYTGSSANLSALRSNIAGPRSRLTQFRQARGISTPDQLTPDHLEELLAGLRRGLSREGYQKYRYNLGVFGKWLHVRHGIDTMRQLPADTAASDRDRMQPPEPEDAVVAFTRVEAMRLIDAAGPKGGRNRVIVKMLLLTGMRPSELCGLMPSSILDDPLRVRIRGSWWDPARPKSKAGYRDIPLNIGDMGLPQDLAAYRLWRADQAASTLHLFLGSRRDGKGNATPLSLEGLKTFLDRLGERTGVHCNPYRFRHTFCTWCADSGLVGERELAGYLGHSDTRKIARYYARRDAHEAAERAARVRF